MVLEPGRAAFLEGRAVPGECTMGCLSAGSQGSEMHLTQSLALAFVSDLQIDLHVGLTSVSSSNLSLLGQQSI